MDWDSYSKIKKHNSKFLQYLIESNSKKAWFICYHLTGSVTKAAPLLINAFKETIDDIAKADAPPRGDFKVLLYSNIYAFSLEELEEDEEFEDLPKPKVSSKYAPFVREIGFVSKKLRNLYIMHTYSGVGVDNLAKISDTTTDDVRIKLKKASDQINKKRPPTDKSNGAALIILSTEFRNPADSGFTSVEVPDFLMISLAQSLGIELVEPLTEEEKKKRVKITLIAFVAVGAMILGIIFIPKLFSAGAPKENDDSDSSAIISSEAYVDETES